MTNKKVFNFDDLTGKKPEQIKEIEKDFLDEKKFKKEITKETSIDVNTGFTTELELVKPPKRAITVTLDDDLIKIIDSKVSKMNSKNSQGMRSKAINAALKRVFK